MEEGKTIKMEFGKTNSVYWFFEVLKDFSESYNTIDEMMVGLKAHLSKY